MTDAQTEGEAGPQPERIEVQRTIPVDAAKVFALVCDPQGHVRIDATGMLMDATGDPATDATAAHALLHVSSRRADRSSADLPGLGPRA